MRLNYEDDDQDKKSPSVSEIILKQITSLVNFSLFRQMIVLWKDLNIPVDKPELEKMHKRHHELNVTHGWNILYAVFALFLACASLASWLFLSAENENRPMLRILLP